MCALFSSPESWSWDISDILPSLEVEFQHGTGRDFAILVSFLYLLSWASSAVAGECLVELGTFHLEALTGNKNSVPAKRETTTALSM